MVSRWSPMLVCAVVAVLGGGAAASAQEPQDLIVQSTTSVRDSGLLEQVIIPDFQDQYPEWRLKVVAVGTGQAIANARAGQGDVLITHSPAQEAKFVADGFSLEDEGRTVMWNDFVVVGPPGDPAGLARTQSAAAAFKRIAAARAPFASRGDDSGTNAKELKIWQSGGVTPRGSWYFKTGQGMGETLTIASQKGAYTLSDRGTFLATKGLQSKILEQGDQALQNYYHVIVVRHSGTNTACANAFSNWITSPSTQRVIGAFGREKYGRALFHPDAGS